MILSDLQTLIASLCRDPNNERYSLVDIGTELDNVMDQWNVEAKIIKDTKTITVVDGTRQYALSGLTGTPISFSRVTHKGIDLEKRSKSYFDLYTNADWTTASGTPNSYYIEAEDANNQFITVKPTPQGIDAGAYLVVEYIKRHTSMSAASDTPFMSGATANSLLRPYDFGLAYAVAAHLLARDPSNENAGRMANYGSLAGSVMRDVIQVFKALEHEEPPRVRGGRNWRGAPGWFRRK